ncbi:MAG: LacI family DNA-binding transcriptional regulator [Candidatus Bipolaricaulota bacterium]|nr:LacI family DNA-binding transcriptional regulator [Candidatus Bipolaricaulota bacterium]
MGTTIEDVAEKADVSITTVSAVINDSRYVSPELTERVEQAIEELNYQPDQLGRGLRKGQSNTIGLLVSDITNPFFPKVARGVEDCVRENHYNLILCNTDEDPVEEKHYISLLRTQRVDGIIVAPTSKGARNLEPLTEESIPIVLIDRSVDGLDLPEITSDNYSGAYRAVEYLIEKGHRKIGFVSGIEGVQSTDKRLSGYKDALSDNSVEFRKDYVVMGNSKINDSYEGAKKLLRSSNGVTAIFASNNMMLIGALQYLKESSISYPEEISVICFDDTEWGNAVTPGITSVSQKPYEIGYEAGKVIFQLISGSAGEVAKDRLVLPTKLVERESVKNLNN